MSAHRSNALDHVSRLRPLAICLAIAISSAVFAGPHPDGPRFPPAGHLAGSESHHQPSSVLFVKNCDDDGPDSLRALIVAAPDGATIDFDLNSMLCSRITLTSGQIDIAVANLTIHGPGADVLTIDGGYTEGYAGRILNHAGNGNLTIERLTLEDAVYLASTNQNPKGGCVYSAGSVALIDSKIRDCRLDATGMLASGGGIWARGLSVLGGSISNCHVASDTDSALGGGAFAGSYGFAMKYSTIENNTAHSDSPNFEGRGGGLAVGASSAEIGFSTIAGNHAETAGGMLVFGLGASANIKDSTLSHNSALTVAGVNIDGVAILDNVTIAFNRATQSGAIAGAHFQSLLSNSSIFGYNVTDDGTSIVETDVKSEDGLITGAHNLIMAANATMPPANTLTACPRLAPLLDNGGPTRTHALLPGSPAIDWGSNAANLNTDQRGPGFDRSIGITSDIGAYEWSERSGDVINMSGFEDCN